MVSLASEEHGPEAPKASLGLGIPSDHKLTA